MFRDDRRFPSQSAQGRARCGTGRRPAGSPHVPRAGMSEAPLSLAGLTEAPVTPDQSAPDVRHPPLVLAAMAALAGAVLVVAILGHTIASGSRFAFDSTIMLALRQDGNLAVPAGPFWLKQAMIDVTALGGETVLTLAVAVTVGFLIASRHLLAAALVFAGTVTGSIAVASVKIWVGRFGELSQRSRRQQRDHLSDDRLAQHPDNHSPDRALVPVRRHRVAGRSDRNEPRLSRRPLAQRRAGRLELRHALGAGLVGIRKLAPAAAYARYACMIIAAAGRGRRLP